VELSHINTIAQILGGGVKKFFKIEHQGANRALRLGLYPFFEGHATHCKFDPRTFTSPFTVKKP